MPRTPTRSSTVSGAVGGQRLTCHLVSWVTRRWIVALGASRFQVRFSSMAHITEWVRLAVMFEAFFFLFWKTFLKRLVKRRFDGQECRLCRECQNLFVILSFVTTKPKIMLSWNWDKNDIIGHVFFFTTKTHFFPPPRENAKIFKTIGYGLRDAWI